MGSRASLHPSTYGFPGQRDSHLYREDPAVKHTADGSRDVKTRLGLQCLALVTLIAAVMPDCSPLRQSSVNSVPTVPPQGVYESCPPHDSRQCLDRLTQIARAGFQIILNYDQFHGTANRELEYAAVAHSLNVKIIWGMSDPVFWNGTDLRRHFSELGATCACTDNRGFISYMVNLVKELPATWGYYIGDEARATDRSKVEAFATLVRQLDSSHPRLYIAGGDSSTLGSNLEPFADTAEVIGADYYPISTGASLDTVGPVAQAVQSVADQQARHSAFILQAFSWGQYPTDSWVCSPFPRCARYPTESEMRMMRDLVLSTAHPVMLLWYSYFDILRSDDPARHWSDLIAAAGVRPGHP